MLHTLCCEEEDFQRARTEWERCAAEESVFDEAVWFRDLDALASLGTRCVQNVLYTCTTFSTPPP